MCDYMYDPGSLCVQVTFDEAQLSDMPLSLERYCQGHKVLKYSTANPKLSKTMVGWEASRANL